MSSSAIFGNCMVKIITITLTSISILYAFSFFQHAHGQESLPEAVLRLELEVQGLRDEIRELKILLEPASNGDNTELAGAVSRIASIFVLPAEFSREFDPNVRAGCNITYSTVAVGEKEILIFSSQIKKIQIMTNKKTPYVISLTAECSSTLQNIECNGREVTQFRDEEIYLIELSPSATGCSARLSLQE